MAWTQTDIVALKKAIATGATRVRYADRDVTYRSLSEMKEILALIEQEVNGSTRIRQIRVNSRKGFDV
jgi:hypothetical protein